jgi:Domain of unknown function (DUF4760)
LQAEVVFCALHILGALELRIPRFEATSEAERSQLTDSPLIRETWHASWQQPLILSNVTLYETWSTAVATLGLVVSSVVLILLLWQLRLLAQQVEDSRKALDFSTAEAEAENERRRQRATMEFIATTMTKLEENYDLVPASGSPLVTEFVDKAMIKDSPEFRALRNYLNYFEDVSVGINLGIFDFEVVNRTAGGRIMRTWEYYKPWILVEREAISPALYSDIEACAAKIRAARQAELVPEAPAAKLTSQSLRTSGAVGAGVKG